MLENFKQSRILMPKWLAAAEGEVCTWPGCGADDRTIVAAHCNEQNAGRGIGKKSHDLFIAFLCNTHHYEYDYGKHLTREAKSINFNAAMKKTWLRLYKKGLIKSE
ncbi:MAG: hypothetical protein PHE50_00045 [Dehalococcoidales bacterium]|nr:hypothetical protein [Dehalococcoidales bacterium]